MCGASRSRRGRPAPWGLIPSTQATGLWREGGRERKVEEAFTSVRHLPGKGGSGACSVDLVTLPWGSTLPTPPRGQDGVGGPQTHPEVGGWYLCHPHHHLWGGRAVRKYDQPQHLVSGAVAAPPTVGTRASQAAPPLAIHQHGGSSQHCTKQPLGVTHVQYFSMLS